MLGDLGISIIGNSRLLPYFAKPAPQLWNSIQFYPDIHYSASSGISV